MVCLDAVSSYLVELKAMTADGTVCQLITQFKGVQAKLERLQADVGRFAMKPGHQWDNGKTRLAQSL